MKSISELISDDIKTVGIAGHVNPDGDCAGSCSAMMQYLAEMQPSLDITLYLEKTDPSLHFLTGIASAKSEPDDVCYDLFILLDTSDEGRIGAAGSLFQKAKHTVCIDHHISNKGFAEINHIEPDASSCCEVLAGLMDENLITPKIAESLYTGIIHDCGVFQYSNTSADTMRTAAMLISKGVDFPRIIDESFNLRTLTQNRIMGTALARTESELGGLVVFSYLTLEDMEKAGANRQDLGIIVSQLRFTAGCEAAVFIYEIEKDCYKVSLRSNRYVDCAKVASRFLGGGHVRAAGFSLEGKPDTIKERIIAALAEELDGIR